MSGKPPTPSSNDPDIAAAAGLFRSLDRELWVLTAATDGLLGGLITTTVAQASIVESRPRVTVGLARQHRRFSSLNYFVFPGVTDDPFEFRALKRLLHRTGPDLIQWRNLNLDPARGEGLRAVAAELHIVPVRSPATPADVLGRDRQTNGNGSGLAALRQLWRPK